MTTASTRPRRRRPSGRVAARARESAGTAHRLSSSCRRATSAQIDDAEDAHDDRHDHADRGAVAEAEIHERLDVDFGRKHVGERARPGAGREPDIDEIVERPEHRHQPEHQHRRHQEGQRDEAELLPAGGAVELGGLVVFVRHRLQAGQQRQRDQRHGVPDHDGDDRRPHRAQIGEERDRLVDDAEPHQRCVDDAVADRAASARSPRRRWAASPTAPAARSA